MSDASAAPAAAQNSWVDPFGAHNFKLMISGMAVGHFTECSGPEITIDTYEYREAGQSQVVHHIPTITSYGEITLRQGLTRSTELWDWFMATVNGEIQRNAVSIILLDARGTTPVVQWNLFDALPVRWIGANLKATAREVYVQEFGLRYESMERAGSRDA